MASCLCTVPSRLYVRDDGGEPASLHYDRGAAVVIADKPRVHDQRPSIARSLLSQIGHRLDEHPRPAATALQVVGVALPITVVCACLDEHTTLWEVSLQLAVHVVQCGPRIASSPQSFGGVPSHPFDVPPGLHDGDLSV